MLHVLTSQFSIIDQILLELRDVRVQENRAHFRYNLKRLGFLMGFEISKKLEYESLEVETQLGIADSKKIKDELVICPILRAGIPMFEGVLECFDQAESAFVSSYRKHQKGGGFEINSLYVTCPNLDQKIMIIVDPMMATGASIESAMQELSRFGTPKQLIIVSAIASKEAVDKMHRLFPKVQFWTAAIDEELTAKAYIVPGLGDAGDLCFGPKMQE